MGVMSSPPPRPGWLPRRFESVDTLLLAAVAGLVLLGLVMTYTASYKLGDAYLGDGAYFFKRQLLWLAVGIVACGIMAAIDYRSWRRFSVLIMAATLLVLLAVLAFGATRFGGQRWVLGGGSIQPSELAKLALVIYVADWLSSKGEDIKDVMLGLIPFAILIGIVSGLVIQQPNFSTALLMALVATAMFFAAGADLTQMLVSGTVAGMVLVGLMLRAPYRLERVRSFLDPAADPTGAGYQVLQTLESIRRGRLVGVGLGAGQQKYLLPAAHTDDVFAVLGEELGLMGCLVVLALFAVVAWRGFRIATGSPDRFASLVAIGITCWLSIQAIVNMGVVTGVLPYTGVPLPFVSYGGSSLVACLAAIGLLANISGRVDPARARVYAHLDLRRGDRRSRLSRAHRARRVER
jgi:cell division protein FtsW